VEDSRYQTYDPNKCLNCGEQFEKEVVFCPTCGQKNRKSELSLIKWLQEGLSTFFHLEGKSWNTLKDLPVPGKLATNYINGKRQRYVHPFRLLVFSSLVCLASITIFSSLIDDELTLIKVGTSNNKKQINTNNITPDSLPPSILTSAYAHPIGRKLRSIDHVRTEIVNHDRFRLLADSMIASGYVSDEAQFILDSLRSFYKMPQSWQGQGHFAVNGDTFNFDSRLVAFGTPAEVVKDYDFKNFGEKIIAKKAIQLYQSGVESVNDYLFSSLSWAVLIFVPFLAFGYKIFYRNKLPYYTQHLTYSAVLMSVALLLVTIGYFFAASFKNPIPFILVALIFFVYNFISDSRVYKVSYGHVFLKSLVFPIYGTLAFFIAFFLWLLGAVLLA